MSHLYQLLEESAKKYPDQIALFHQAHKISYRMLNDSVNRMALGLLKLGLGQGDRLAVMLPNIPHFTITFFAAMKLGITLVPISIYYKADEIHHQLEDSEIKGIVFFEKFRDDVHRAVVDLESCQQCIVLGRQVDEGENSLLSLIEKSSALEAEVEIDGDDTALIVYTAGSVGRLRGAELTHNNLLANVKSCFEFLNLTSEDKVIGVTPFFHPLGFSLIQNTFISAGASVFLQTKLHPEDILDTIEAHKITYMVGVPSTYRELLKADPERKRDFSSISALLSSGDAMDQETINVYEEEYKVQLLEGYGLTEASPMVSFNKKNGIHRAGSIGLPLLGVDMRIVDDSGAEVMPGQVGEIIVKGPNVMKGYLNRPEATKEALHDGWFYTGDMARLDESGYAFIVVRKKNVIVKSGFNVYPREVEKFLLGYPKIKEAAVIGIPDDIHGETIHACIVLKEGETVVDHEIDNYNKSRMAAYKCPSVLHFYESLPKGPTGRVSRDKLRKDLNDQLNAEKQV